MRPHRERSLSTVSTATNINVREEWLAVWMVPVADPERGSEVATSVGRRVRELVDDDPELAKSVGLAGIFYMLASDREPMRNS